MCYIISMNTQEITTDDNSPGGAHPGDAASGQPEAEQPTAEMFATGAADAPAVSAMSGSLVIAAGFLVIGLLAATLWEVGFAFGSPLDWLAHGGPGRLLGLSVVSIIPAFLLGASLLTRPGARLVLMLMAAVGALPVIAILNGSVYRTVVVKSVKYTQEMLEPAVLAMEQGREETGAWPEDISVSLVGAFGMDMADVYAGGDYFVISTTGYAGKGEGATIYYHSGMKEWKRFHTDRRESPAAVKYAEATRGVTPVEYRMDEHGVWRRL